MCGACGECSYTRQSTVESKRLGGTLQVNRPGGPTMRGCVWMVPSDKYLWIECYRPKWRQATDLQ
jgi:hypothetical protein